MSNQTKRIDTPGEAAARKLAVMQACCANDAWRHRLCEYHSGFADGYDAAHEGGVSRQIAAIEEATNNMEDRNG